MHAPKEVRKIINRLRKRFGKCNGVVRAGLFDLPTLDRKWKNSKRNYRRSKKT